MKAKLMTKLALAAVVACAAVGGAKAKTLHYKISGVSSSPGNDLTSANQYATYLFFTDGTKNGIQSFSSTITTIDAVKEELAKGSEGNLGSLNLNYPVAKNTYENGTASFSYSNDYIWPGTSTKSTWVYGAVVNAFAVILDATSLSDAKYYMIAETGGNQIQSAKDNSTSNPSEFTINWGSQANNSWVSLGTVPEPTSGVLLLVGVAALALRRKKAA